MKEYLDVMYPLAIVALGVLNYLASRKKGLAEEIGAAIQAKIDNHKLDPHAHEGFYVRRSVTRGDNN